jgi:hypothetical protein
MTEPTPKVSPGTGPSRKRLKQPLAAQLLAEQAQHPPLRCGRRFTLRGASQKVLVLLCSCLGIPTPGYPGSHFPCALCRTQIPASGQLPFYGNIRAMASDLWVLTLNQLV